MKTDTARKKKQAKTKKKNSFPVVAIGASKGGLDAISALIKNLAPDTGMAFIVVQHLSPDNKSYLTEILSRLTSMKVQKIENMDLMAPDNIYVIPPDKGIEVTNGHIRLSARAKSPSTTIDILFSSLAETHGRNVIGIILSGNGTDGTIGLKAIKDHGGTTFAQDDTAQALSMPNSAIASSIVDHILSPEQIARELASLSKNGFPMQRKKSITITGNIKASTEDYKAIFEILLDKTGIDFSHYKMATIKRRMTHRMLRSGIKSLRVYSKVLSKSKEEVLLLNKDLLINVTSFFRDSEVFTYLQNSFLPKLIQSKSPNETMRIWVPACSTGEEAYSLAILLSEILEKHKKISFQIFATDISDQSVHTARMGEYPHQIVESISEERLHRFFIKSGENYRVVKELRDKCVFASHNILRDPPFSRLDIISCRNMLIYLDSVAQKRVLATFHFALNEGGSLLLGRSESAGASSLLFSQSDPKLKIFTRKSTPNVRTTPQISSSFHTKSKNHIKAASNESSAGKIKDMDSVIDSLLLSRYMPACAIINKDMEILQFRGTTSVYLVHPPGKASLNILKMTRPEFAFELRNAINTVIKTKRSVQKSGIEIKINSLYQMMTLEVSPIKSGSDESLFLVVFTLQKELIDREKSGGKSKTPLKDKKILKLTEELNSARAEIYQAVQSQETAYEELQAANEEIVSTNEELQTLNEELETSKEETEATNEELITTNQELKTHNELLTESYNFLKQ